MTRSSSFQPKHPRTHIFLGSIVIAAHFGDILEWFSIKKEQENKGLELENDNLKLKLELQQQEQQSTPDNEE